MELLHSVTTAEEKNYKKVASTVSFSFSYDCPFFYLGKNQQASTLTADSETKRYYSENYLSARTRLLRIIELKQASPELIIIDVPFVKSEIKRFVSWLRGMEELQNIPLVYNKTAISDLQIEELQQMRLVDDIMDFSANQKELTKKVKFLKKVKEHGKKEPNSVNHISKKIVFTARNKANYSLKRILDITIASVLILVSLPILLLIAIAIRIESKGPILYAANRAGRGFKIFKFFKFRTMVVDADKKVADLVKLNMYNTDSTTAKFFKLKDDPRVTKVGAFLRNTSLDELPQFFNVLKGDMSIVGNRPLPLYEAATLTTDEWAERFMAPAGITGLWQIKKRGTADMSDEERINLDITYARSNSFMNDIWIMVNTPTALLQKTNV